MAYPQAKIVEDLYDPTQLVPRIRVANEVRRELNAVDVVVHEHLYGQDIKELELRIKRARKAHVNFAVDVEASCRVERRKSLVDRRSSGRADPGGVYSALWPTVAFSIGLVSLLFAVIFISQGQLSRFIPASFAAFVFMSISYVSMRIRRQVKRAWRASLTTD